MIPPSEVHPQAAQALLHYLIREIYQARSERRGMEERWNRFEKSYRALPEQEVKEFPFLGAANLVIPVVATDVDTIYSRILGILFAPDNLWSMRALRPEMVDYAPRIQEFMTWAQHNELNAYDAIADWTMEICKLGTGILKQRYKRRSRWIYQFRETPEGTLQQVREALINDHPVMEHVSLYDFLMPSTATDIQTAPWVSERVLLTWEQYQERVRAGIYLHSERITRAHAHEKGSFIEQERMRLDAFQPSMGDKVEFWETWTDFDIGGNGRRLPLVVTIHIPSQTLVRIDYNPFLNQERPYSAARFLRQSKRFYGIGLAEMLMPTQDEVTAMHNQRIDAGTVANAPMWWARSGKGIRENEPVWPGRFFITDDPTDIQPLALQTRAFDPNITNEQITMDYARRRTGVNDILAGVSGPSTSYATATTSIHLLQESARKIDQTLREMRNALGETGTRVLELYQQFNQGGKVFAVMGPQEGQMVQQVLQFPLEMMRFSVGVDTTATSASLNKEVEIRTNTIVMEMTTGFYQQMFQGMAAVVNPQLPPPLRHLAMQMVMGGAHLMRRLLDSYGIQDVDRLIPDPREAMNVGQGVGPGGAGGAIPPAQAPGMAGVPAGAGGPPQGGLLPPGSSGY